jgi:diguanylate cyclase (GGDEF)-like protein/PAS domain S-box-containing protein
MRKRYNILFIDEKRQHNKINKALQKTNDNDLYRYTLASSINEAEELITNDAFDILVTTSTFDNGSDKSYEHICRQMPVIVVGDVHREDIIIKAIDMGVSDYIPKDPDYQFIQQLPLSFVKALKNHLYQTNLKESENKFKTQYKYIPLPTYTWKKTPQDFVLYDYNKEAEKVTKGKIKALKGESLSILYKDNPEIIKDINQCYTNKTNIRKEMEYTFKSTGEFKYLNVHYVYIEPDLVMVHTENITGKKQAIIDLSESEKKYRELIELVPQAIFEIDIHGNLTYVNEPGLKMFGYTKQDLKEGLYALDLFITEEREKVKQDIEYAMREKPNMPVEYTAIKKDGTVFDGMVFPKQIKQGSRVTGLRGILIDISSRKTIEDDLRKEKEKAQKYLDIAGVIILTLDRDGNISMINRKGCEILGYEEKELLGKNWIETCIPEDRREGVVGIFSNVLQGKHDFSVDIEDYILTKNGERRFIQWHNTIFQDDDGNITGSLSSGMDITLKKQVEEDIRLLSKVFEWSNDAIAITDPNADIINVNDSFTNITGFSKKEAIGNNMRMLKSGKHDEEFYQKMWDSLINEGQWKGEIWDRRRNGEIYPKWTSISSVKDDYGKTIYYLSIFSDITQIKEAEERLRRMAHYDMLTGLPNRVLFRDRLDNSVKRAMRENTHIGVMFIDLDGFKKVNDTMGHRAGDKLLVEVAKRLSMCIRRSDTVARLGGDEFTVIMLNIKSMRSADIIARRITKTLSQPFILDSKEVYITASIGIASYPDDGKDADELIKNADTAMYHAKERGKNNYQFYSEFMNVRIKKKMEVESQLIRALEQEEFVMHYQPQINSKTGNIIGMEALIRWKHPEKGMVYPADFIPIAEETGIIIRIGEWTIHEVCKQIKRWQEASIEKPYVTINISGKHLKNHEFANFMKDVLHQYRIEPGLITLEITETDIMKDTERKNEIFEKLKNLGIDISIDEFGMGYSSLNYLKTFSINTLKIERTFVNNDTSDKSDFAIIKAIISLAKALDLNVVAEGVETKEQLDFLRRNGCDYYQGFYFSKALDEESITRLIKDVGMGR